MNTSPETVTKIEKMDYLISHEENLTASVVQKVVEDIFGITIHYSDAKQSGQLEEFEKKLQQLKPELNGEDVRKLINEFFRINLDGVASLERARISLFSKGQWISKRDTDLVVVYTGEGDVDVEISTSPYFVEKTSDSTPPEALKQALLPLGYEYDSNKNKLVYRQPQNQAVPDSFKGQTIGAIVQVIQREYSHY